MDPEEYTEEPYAAPPRLVPWDGKIDSARYAFYGGLAGGVMILVAAFLGALFLMAMATLGGGLPSWAWGSHVPLLIGVWGLATGGAVVLAALRLKDAPHQAGLPGVAMIVCGVLSFFALGGFILGGLLAILSGVLAVSASRALWVPRSRKARRDYA